MYLYTYILNELLTSEISAMYKGKAVKEIPAEIPIKNLPM